MCESVAPLIAGHRGGGLQVGGEKGLHDAQHVEGLPNRVPVRVLCVGKARGRDTDRYKFTEMLLHVYAMQGL